MRSELENAISRSERNAPTSEETSLKAFCSTKQNSLSWIRYRNLEVILCVLLWASAMKRVDIYWHGMPQFDSSFFSYCSQYLHPKLYVAGHWRGRESRIGKRRSTSRRKRRIRKNENLHEDLLTVLSESR